MYSTGDLQQTKMDCMKSYLQVCAKVHQYPECCVPGALKTIYNKYTILSAVVHAGFDALYIDFDTILLQDPLPSIMEAAKEAEVLVSRDFGIVAVRSVCPTKCLVPQTHRDAQHAPDKLEYHHTYVIQEQWKVYVHQNKSMCTQ